MSESHIDAQMDRETAIAGLENAARRYAAAFLAIAAGEGNQEQLLVARGLLVEAAWHYRHHPRTSARAANLAGHVPPEVSAHAWQAQVRLHHRYRVLGEHGKRSTVANVAVARELTAA